MTEHQLPARLEELGIGQLFWIIRDAVVVGDASTGAIVFWSPSAEQMLGYTAAEAVGQPIEILVAEHLRAAHRAGLKRYRSTGHGEMIDRGVPVELPAVHRSGARLWVELSLTPIRQPHIKQHLVLAVIRDITLRRQAEAEQRERERAEALAAERSAILDQIAEGVIIADAQGRITYVNRAAERLHGRGDLGVPVESYATVFQLRTPDGGPFPSEDLPLARAVRLGETVLDARWRIVRPDGVEVIAEGSAGPVVGGDGTRLGSVLVMRDVTAQAALEQEKDDFLAAVSHDLKNPLTAVQAIAQLLRRQAASPGGIPTDRLLERLANIEDATRRMHAMLDQLLDLGRLTMDRPRDPLTNPIDLVDMARRSIAEQQALQPGAQLRLATDEPNLVGLWDSTQLERVLSNLVENAIKYSPCAGEVVVHVARAADATGDWAVLEVTDQGLGIPAADLPHIFDRFRRGTNVIGQIAGTGIGLSAVRGIVDRLGGSVSVSSREGSGSTFTVRLPLPGPPQPTPAG